MKNSDFVTQQRGTDEMSDRVRAHSAEDVNRMIDEGSRRCLEQLSEADGKQSTKHIDDLSRECDTERYLQTNASILALSGIVLGSTVSRKFLMLPAIVFGFFFQHGVQGWCPPLPVFRRLGVRTRKEINREKYALKALRGDFDDLPEDAGQTKPEQAESAMQGSMAL